MTAGKIERIAGRGLRITALEIRNLWGVAEAIIRPGQRNIIRGANGTGKTAILESIQLALGGGTLGKFQRLGSEGEPQIVLEIEGPKDSIRVEREGDKPPRVLRRVGDSEAFEKVQAPATFLKGLFDTKASNPFAFLDASDDERAQLLLEALDVKMDEDALRGVLDKDEPLAGDIPKSLHPLVRLALIHDRIYSARRGFNVDAEGKAKAAEQLKRSVPHERIPDATEQIAALEERVIAEAEGIARQDESDDAEMGRAIGEQKAAHEKWASEMRAETERLIASGAQTLEVGIQGLRESRELAREKIAAAAEALTAQRERLATLRAQQAEFARHENLRAEIARFEKLAEDSKIDAARLTKVLEGLEALKRQLASRLPIPGLDIAGNEIRVNGIRWQDLNAGQQGAIAALVALSRARRSRLPVVFLDEAERFDEAHIEAVAKTIEEAGAQFFCAVVAREGELTIEADGEFTGSVRVDAPADPVVRR